jgi:hypothetical protein
MFLPNYFRAAANFFFLSTKRMPVPGHLMPSYTYSRGIAPRAKKETLEEVKARIRKAIEDRTEERLRYWISLAEWCNSKPGRYIRVNWGSEIITCSEGISFVEIPD